jgi:hypothetical protein
MDMDSYRKYVDSFEIIEGTTCRPLIVPTKSNPVYNKGNSRSNEPNMAVY